ncbi:MAG: quinohemoprotein ethanol dehydrogenase [Solirubrobacterales bacterium]|jgi:glucose dehydrogenase|nr:quinohemoprotein ethanol dehydrogenase [Solirubrobacterales bacterium]
MRNLSSVSKAARAAIGLLAIMVVTAAVFAGCGSSSSGSSEDASFTGSGVPNGDVANTRHQSGGPIDSSTVSDLQVAWKLPLHATSAFGSYASTPIISKGVMYSQDLASNVQAIDVQSGEVLWTANFEQPDHGPNGVVVAEGLVFGATPTEAFALDQATGQEEWSVKLARNGKEGIDMAPGFRDGLVYVSTVPVNVEEFYGGDGVGILWALDGKTGKKVWHFNTVPNDLWTNSSAARNLNSGGGLWYPPAFDEEGSMYVAVGNPGPIPGTEKYPWGSSRPGPDLYTDSIVKLDAKTGKMDWYFQLTPHDVNDWDLQDPPILIKSGGKDMVIGAGKSGIVIALDRSSGKLLWKRPVGIHSGWDDIGREAMQGKTPKLPITVLPGSLGGVIAPMASDGTTVFVPVVNSSLTISSQSEKSEGGPGNGEVVALDATTGKVKWKEEMATPAFGYMTAVNDLVFSTTYDGTVSAFDTKSGTVVWREKLPAGTNSGVTVADDMLIAPAGVAAAEGQVPQIVAYRLGG